MQRKILSLMLIAIFAVMLFGPAVYAGGVTPAPAGEVKSSVPSVKIEDGQMIMTGENFETNSDKAWTNFLGRYRKIIGGVTGVVSITLFIALVIQVGRLGVNSTTPQGRSSALSAIMWTGIATALLGSASIFFSFFFTAIGNNTAI